jgi:CDP-glucose 4,6-dehydratase
MSAPPAGRSVLVTGAFGLLGGRLTARLLELGARVTVLRRDRTLSALALEGHLEAVAVVTGDVTDGPLLERALAEYEVDAVFHLAAQTLVGVGVRSPLATFETNVRGTWTVLEACRRTGVSEVIVAASDKAYGRHETLPYRESHPLMPEAPYDVSKAAADLITRSYWHTYGLPVAVTRFANLYGGGDLNLSRLIPEVVLAALDGRAPVIRSDGSPQRDFLFVQDAVEAYLAIWRLLAAGRGRGEAFNAGSGRPSSVRDIVERICRLSGSDVAPDIRGEGVPATEIDRQWVDPGKLSSATGWSAQVGLDDGLGRTIEWYRHYLPQLRSHWPAPA